jgi:hypothetical protein
MLTPYRTKDISLKPKPQALAQVGTGSNSHEHLRAPITNKQIFQVWLHKRQLGRNDQRYRPNDLNTLAKLRYRKQLICHARFLKHALEPLDSIRPLLHDSNNQARGLMHRNIKCTVPLFTLLKDCLCFTAHPEGGLPLQQQLQAFNVPCINIPFMPCQRSERSVSICCFTFRTPCSAATPPSGSGR